MVFVAALPGMLLLLRLLSASPSAGCSKLEGTQSVFSETSFFTNLNVQRWGKSQYLSRIYFILAVLLKEINTNEAYSLTCTQGSKCSYYDRRGGGRSVREGARQKHNPRKIIH